jgi:hypothetical protein
MTLLTKIILIVSGVVVFGAVGFIIYQQIEMRKMQTAINESVIAQKQLVDGIVRSQATYASKDDLNNFAKQNGLDLNDLKNDLSSLNATITGVNHVNVGSGGVIQTNVGSTSTTPDAHPTTAPTVTCDGKQIPCPNADPYGYASNVQHLELTEPFGTNTNVPIGNVSFDASNKAPWSETIYPRTYSINNVLATTNDGRHVMYNKMTITSNGKTVPITIANAQFEEQYPANSFSFWNPRLYLTAGGAVDVSHLAGSGNIGATFQVMSYGKTLAQPAISILQLGVGYQTYTRTAAAILNPVSFSLSGILPKGIVDSTYVGPSLQVDMKGNMYAGGNISVGF